MKSSASPDFLDLTALKQGVQPVTVQLFASPTPTANSAELLLATRQQNVRLNPRGSVNLQLSAPTPTTLPTGNYFLLAEVNGSIVTAAPVRIQSPFSDLAVNFAGLPSRPVEIDGPSAGRRTAMVNVVNTGNVKVRGKVNVSFYISADGTLDSGDALLATVANVPVALKAGAKKAVSFHIAVPAGTAVGGYFLFAKLSPLMAATDVNSANNVAVSSSRLAIVNQLPRPTTVNRTVNIYSSGGGAYSAGDNSSNCSEGGGTEVVVISNSGGDSSYAYDQQVSVDNSSAGDSSANSPSTDSTGGTAPVNDSSTSSSSSGESTDNWDSGSIDSSGGDF